jgi:hypothetical protein
MLHVWIRDVVSGSDPHTRFTVPDDDDVDDSSSNLPKDGRQQEGNNDKKYWMELLKERQAAGRCDASFNQWLSKVILISAPKLLKTESVSS